MATAPTPITSATSALRDSLQVKPPSEVIDWINALIYGEPGTGKTHLVGTADDDPRTSPVLIADVEGGVITIRHRQDIDVVSVRSLKALEDLYNTLYKSIDPKTNTIHYKTVAIDSLTELADLDMRTIMREAYGRNPTNIDIDVPSPREWGKTRNHIRTIVRAFRDLPCHVIFTAHVGSMSDEGMPTKYFPGFSGKLRTEVAGFMDIVGYLTAKVQQVDGEGVIVRSLQVAGTNRVVAKDRTSALGDVVVNPTIPKLWDMIQEDQAQVQAQVVKPNTATEG
jgi:phage nucleotide-binding protein